MRTPVLGLHRPGSTVAPPGPSPAPPGVGAFALRESSTRLSNGARFKRHQDIMRLWHFAVPNFFNNGVAGMLYRPSTPKPSGKFGELVLLFAVIVAVIVAVGAIWATWDGRWGRSLIQLVGRSYPAPEPHADIPTHPSDTSVSRSQTLLGRSGDWPLWPGLRQRCGPL
jgi:hypothetical protein